MEYSDREELEKILGLSSGKDQVSDTNVEELRKIFNVPTPQRLTRFAEDGSNPAFYAKGNAENRLKYQQDEIDDQIKNLDVISNVNKDRWKKEASKDSYTGNVGMGFGHSSQFNQAPQEQKQLEATRFQLERARKALNTYTEQDQQEDIKAGNEKAWYEELWGGLKNTNFEDIANIATLGYAGVGNSSKINAILDKASRGEELSEIERLAVESYRQTQQANSYVEERGGGTILNTIGEGIPATAEFMLGTATFGGPMGITKAALKNGVWKAIGSASLREGIRTPMRGAMLSNYNDRTASQYGFDDQGNIIKDETSTAERLWKSFATTYAEGLSEQAGNFIGGGMIGRGLKKVTPKLLGKKIGATMADGVELLADKFKKPNEFLQKAFNWNGTFDEYLEEQVNMVIDPLLTGEPERLKEIFNAKNQLIALGSVAAIGGTTHVLSYPSIVQDEIKGGSMRRDRNKSISAIADEDIRQGVYDAVKQGQTVEERANMFSAIDWSKATPSDAANGIDAFTRSINYDLYKGFDESKQSEKLAALKAKEYSDVFKQLANKDDGMVHLLADDRGNQYYLLEGSLDDQSVDGMSFVRNATSGLTELVQSHLLTTLEKSSYTQGLDALFGELSVNVESEQQMSRMAQDKEDAAEVGVKHGNYKRGQMVQLSDGRTAEYFVDNGDGVGAQVRFYDAETDEYIPEDVAVDKIVGLAPTADETTEVSDNQVTAEPITATVEDISSDAVSMPNIELTEQAWNDTFGTENTIQTPIGVVKMGENQMKKLLLNNREGQFGMVVQTLKDPTVIIDESRDDKNAAVFVKSFFNEKDKLRYYSNIVVDKEGQIINISSHHLREPQVKEKIEKGKLLYKTTRLNTSDQASLEQSPEVAGVSTLSEDKATNSVPQTQVPKKIIPLLKDGSPDYDSMPADMYLEEYSKISSREDALADIRDEHADIEDEIRKLEAKKTLKRNEKIKNRAKIVELRTKADDIASVLAQNEPAKADPQPSYSVGENVRQQYTEAPKEYGVQKSIIAPNDESIPGRYVLLESGAVTASHNAQTFVQSEGFPVTESGSTVNDRDYGKDKQAQQQVISIAQRYNGRAIDNPVVVTPDGVVISGNNRTMSGELAAKSGTDKAYLQHLTENAAQYGFTAEQVAQFKNPRIVFETAAPQPYNTETFSKFNAQETKTQNKVEKAIKIGKTIGDKTVRRVSSIVDEYETLGELYGTPTAVNQVIKTLQDAGVINQNEVAELKDGDSLSGTGKDMVETMLVGSVLSEDAVRLINSDGMKRYRQRITKAILPILDNSTLGDYSIADQVSEAVTLLDRARQRKSSVDDTLSMKDMFEQTEYSPVSIAIARALESSDKGVRELFTQYNSVAAAPARGQLDMMENRLIPKEQILQSMGIVPQEQQNTTQNENTTPPSVQPGTQTIAKPITKPKREDTGQELQITDLIASADTPQQKHRAVSEYVAQLNELSGANAVVFSEISELPENISNIFSEQWQSEPGQETPGVFIDGKVYIHAPHIHSVAEAKTTYTHEVVGHKFINDSIKTSTEKISFFNAIVDDIGIGKMLEMKSDELNGEIDRYGRGDITSWQLGREYVAYLAQNNFDTSEYLNSTKELPLYVDLSGSITNNDLIQIIKSTNNGLRTIKIGTGASYEHGLYDSLYTDDKQFDRGRGNAGTSVQNKDTTSGDLGTATELQQGVKPIRQPQTGTENSATEIREDGFPTINGVEQGAGSPSIGNDGIEQVTNKNNTLQNAIHINDIISKEPGSSQVFQSPKRTGTEQINIDNNVRNLSGDRQRHRTDGTNEIPLNERDILDADGRRGRRMGDEISQGDRVANRELQRGASTGVLPASVSGERSDNGVSSQNSPDLRTSGIDARNTVTPGYDLHSGEGNTVNNTAGVADGNRADHGNGDSFAKRTVRAKLKQKQAESIPVSIMDMNNIRSTLPLLLPEQQDDVYKAEIRFYSDEHKIAALSFGKGMLFTNGTGTGKTYTGFGVIKRFYKLGKKNMLIVVPAEAKIDDWTKESKSFSLDVHTLESTKDKGKDISITTYANFRANNALKERDFDLIIYDECHRLMESNKGDYSSTSLAHFQMCNRNLNDALARLKSVHPLWIKENQIRDEINLLGESKIDRTSQISALKTRLDGIKALQNSALPDIEINAQKAVEKTKVLYLSATPFKSYFNLRYANGTLFDWSGNEQANNSGSRIDAESAFLLDNFGSNFEWKYHRLQQKDKSNAEAIAMQEVEFADKLFKAGVMSSRAIESNMDYSREFPLVTLGRADVFNEGFNDLFSYGENAKFGNIAEFARKIFYDHNYSTQLYESLRASMSIDRIRRHIDLGRKIVVFHRRKQANTSPPFRAVLSLARKEAAKILEGRFVGNHEKTRAEKIIAECNLFEKTNFELLNYEQSLDYSSAIDQITKAFGSKKVVTMNGDTLKSQKSKNIERFNDDNSGVDIIVIQEEAGKEGISLHDKTGKHQRVLMNMSLPVSSTTALQIEGRIYRIGQESNAIFEYPLLGLDMEIANFGQTINRKLSTTENLAAGSQARDLIRSFAEGVLSNSSADHPNINQGQGGKEYDKRSASDVNPFNKAVLIYDTNQKNRAHRNQREGTDFYATPEPIGFKMAEMLNLRNGDSVLEPSAGDGRIAMWFPDFSNSTIIEPSYTLFSKASARAGGGNRKFINSQFEDFNIVNKFDGIAMNPPFGNGGTMAMTHIEKAFGHLKENGRIVAIVPRGAMDNKLNDFLYGQTAQGKLKHADAHLVASINLPNVAFEQVGTNVGTRIVVIDKISTNHNESVYNTDLSYIKDVKELFSSIEDIIIPNRHSVSEISNLQDVEQRESSFDSFVQQHSQTGADLYTASAKRYLGDDYKAINALAKKHGGHYSSYSNKEANVRSGFIFSNKDSVDIFIAEANKILSGEDIDSDVIRFREVETSPEMEHIKSDAVKSGVFMRAPNGGPTNLNERQWLQVRTSAFKDWFGDWEKAARIEKLRNSVQVEITKNDYTGKYELNRDAAQQWLLDNVRCEYVINDTGEKVSLSRLGVKKVTSHSMGNEAHLKSISVIPKLIENSIFITEIQNEKDNGKFDSYRYYVCGLNIDDIPHTAKVTVGVKGGKKYYDHSLTEIEKGALIDNIDELTSPFDNNQNTSSEYKDSKLLEILQNNSSKVVDANGEPMVVYHGTESDFSEFRYDEMSKVEGSFFFAQNIEDAEGYSSGSVMDVFVNLRNPVDFNELPLDVLRLDDKKAIVEKLKSRGHDGWMADMEDGWGEVSAFYPSQIKSATDNRGTFNGTDPDIRYRDLSEINGTFNSELQQLIDGSLGTGHVFSLGMPSEALLLSGVPELPIELSATRLKAKSEQENHKFDLGNVVNLPDAIANPIAVFDSTKGGASKVILTELSNGKDNFVVVLNVHNKGRGRNNIEVNDIVSLYPKDHFQGIADWINSGLMRWVNKEKASEFISVQWPNYIGNGDKIKGSNSVTKVIENFENPTFEIRNHGNDISLKELETQHEYEQNKERKYTSPDKRKAQVVEQLQKLSKEFHTEVVVVDSVRELPDNLRYSTRGKQFSGFYHKPSSKVYFVASAIRDADDATAAFLHEVVSHKGIDGLMGKEKANEFYAAVFDSLKADEQSRLLAKYGNKVIAGDEAVARMAEGDVIPSTMQRIIAAVRRFFREVLGIPLTISDNDIRYILWKSKNNLQQAKTVGQVISVVQRDKALQNKLYPKPKSLMDQIDEVAIRYRDAEQPPRNEVDTTKFRVSGKKNSLSSNAIQVQEALQDSTIKVKLLQDEVKKRGGSIDMFTNEYESLNHRDSRADAAMQKYTRTHIEPFVKFVSGLKDITYNDASDYMLAKHSLERDASGISALDKDIDGKWTKENAQKLVADFENKVSEQELNKLWSMWRKATNEILEIAVQSGRMSHEERNAILGKEWTHYVPLRGKDFDFEGTQDIREVFHYDRTGRGSSGSNPSKEIVAIKALGRASKAEDPISTLQNMAHLEIYMGEVNKSHIPLLRLAQKYPEMTDLFQMRERWYVKYGQEWKPSDTKPDKSEIEASVAARKAIKKYEEQLSEKLKEDMIPELKEFVIEGLREKIEQERNNITVTRRELEARGYTGAPESINNVIIMRDGVKYVVRLDDAEVAQAINNRSGSVQSWMSRYPGRVTRVMSQLATSKNPAFLFPNFLRDLQHATLYNWVDSDGNTKDFLKYATVSWKTLHRNIRGTANPLTQSEIGTLNLYNKTEREILVQKYGKNRVNDTFYDLFVMNGGETGYVHILDPKEYQQKLKKEIATMTGKGALNGTKRWWKAINNGIDYTANMSENAVRYATFMSQIDNGSNVFDAVTYAKNITVNFNRKGKYSKGIGGLFMFFNAGVQGAQNGYSLWGNKKGKSTEEIAKQRGRFIFANAVLATVGYFAAAFLYEMLQGLVGDDGEEFQISDYERRTNLIVPMPGTEKGYIKMPIPILFRPFYSLGVMTNDWVNGRVDTRDVMATSFGNIFDAVSPLQVSYDINSDNFIGSVSKSMIPSAIKPWTDVLMYNHDFAGRKINKESPYSPNTPDSELGQANANKLAISISKWFNKLGGGNEFTPAGIDEHGQKNALNWMDISPSTIEHFVTQYTGGIGKIINETIVTLTADSVDVRKIPIANRFIGQVYEKDPSKEYYDIKSNVEWTERNIRQSEEKGVENALFPAEELPEKKQYYKEQRTKLRQTERRIGDIKKQLEGVQFGSDEYDALESQIDRLQREFIKEYRTDDKRN